MHQLFHEGMVPMCTGTSTKYMEDDLVLQITFCDFLFAVVLFQVCM